MGWISLILSSLPALLAALSSLWAVIGPWLTHKAAAATAGTEHAMSSTDYTVYTWGQGGFAVALAGVAMALRPTAIEMHKQFMKVQTQRAHAARVAELRDEVELLPMASRNELFGK